MEMNKCSHLNKSSRRRFEVEWGGRNESAWTFECPQGLYQSLLCSSPWPCGIRTDTVPTLLLGAVPCPDHNPGKSPNWSWSLALWGPHSCPGLPTRPFPMVWRMGRKKGIVGREGEVKRPWGRLHKLNPIFKTVYVTPNHQSIYVFWAAGCGLGKAVTKLPVWCWELQATQSSEFSSVHRSEQMLGWWGSRLEHVGGGPHFLCGAKAWALFIPSLPVVIETGTLKGKANSHCQNLEARVLQKHIILKYWTESSHSHQTSETGATVFPLPTQALALHLLMC